MLILATMIVPRPKFVVDYADSCNDDHTNEICMNMTKFLIVNALAMNIVNCSYFVAMIKSLNSTFATNIFINLLPSCRHGFHDSIAM
jgi:hypothetical protein